MDFEVIQTAARTIEDRTGRDHKVALVLGSGLGPYADDVPDPILISYSEIPGFPVPNVEGHGGRLGSTNLGNGNALVFAGRVHLYEGWSLDEIVFAVRVLL